MKIRFKKITVLFAIIFFVFSCNSLLAASDPPNLGDAFTNVGNTGKEAGYETDVEILEVLTVIINTVISLLGVIFISLMVYGGYIWMTARGNEEQVEKAKKLITAAVIGVVIVLAAYAISYFVISNIGNATLQASSPQTGNQNVGP